MIKAITIRQRNNLLTLLGAVGCGLTLLTACAEYDDPDFVPVTGAVKHTQLALSASGSSATTRMSEAITQANEEAEGLFRGISDLFLLPFQITNTTREYIQPGNAPSGSQVVAGNNTIGIAGQNVTPEVLNIGPNSAYYFDVVIPIGTNAFLTYGRATGNKSTVAEKQSNGILDATGLTSTVSTRPSGISFAPVQMVSAVTSNGAAGDAGDAIITYLNSIFNKDWADEANHPALNGLYDVVKNMKAGSSASVLAFVQEIYEALKGASGTDVENVLKAIAGIETIDDEHPLPTSITALPDACQGYPTTDLGLPDGAAVIKWVETVENDAVTEAKFVAVTDKNNLGAMNVDVTNFVFPAELYYRSNSRIHTSEVELTDPESQAKAIFVTGHSAWDNAETAVLDQKLGDNDFFIPNGMVFNTTTVVAITDPLQYAVSRLDLRLEAKDGSTTLTGLVDKAGTTFTLDKLPITGILVGQQSPVDYLFHSKWTQESDPLYTIYDSAIEGEINAKDADDADVYTHTLVLETVKDQTVNVAIELMNNSGTSILTRVPGDTEDQIIPNGCKFYLVGTLNPKELNEDGTTYKFGYDPDVPEKNRVFCQDHVTQVTFTVKDLTKAYYVIPPLTSADLEISLGTNPWIVSTPAGFELQ